MKRVITILAAASLLAGPAAAEEGMWTFDHAPLAAINKTLGVGLDQAWLDRIRSAAVRINGCSASFVSGEGLIMTNYHCVAGCVQALSSGQNDYSKGFFTDARPEEKACPGQVAEVLTAITDVTPAIQAATAGKDGAVYVRARDQASLEAERTACPGADARQRCQTISLYGGQRYAVYHFHRYTDVRLVFAPEFDLAFFGGDPDNFNFPRYNWDCSFLRAYEDGKPAATPAHLTFAGRAPKPDEPVFVIGNPGGTERDKTAAELAAYRDIVFPVDLVQRAELRGRLIEYMGRGPEQKRVGEEELNGLENSFKVYYGRQQALNDPATFAVKQKDDTDLKAKIRANAKLAKEIGDPWAEIAKAQTAFADHYLSYRELEQQAGSNSDLYGWARLLVRAAQERAKPAGERRPDYSDEALARREHGILDPQPIEPGLEQLYLDFWFLKVRERLGADDPAVRTLLGRESPESLSARLVSGTKLADPAVRRALWQGGLPAIQASTDPLIQYVLRVDSLGTAQRDLWESQVTAPIERAQTRLARARFAIYGESRYPDATFSLRLSYGRVAGWSYRGVTVPATTNFGGLYTRTTGQPPFALPPSWVKAQQALDPATVFDISSSNDIIGGNSGSPMINAQGQALGLVFDGNIHSLGGDYLYEPAINLYEPAINRAVSVSTVAISEGLAKVYGRTALVAELNRP